MSCNNNFPPNSYCCDVFQSGCVYYDGPSLCVDLPTIAYLNDVLSAISAASCNGGVYNYDYKCLNTYTITNQEQYVEAIADIICKILGTFTPSTVQSITDLLNLIETLNNRVAVYNTVPILGCFAPLSGLDGTVTLNGIIQALQQVICNINDSLTAFDDSKVRVQSSDGVSGYLEDKIVYGDNVSINILARGEDEKLELNFESGIVNPISAADSSSLDFTITGDDENTIKIDVKKDPSILNGIQILSDGLYISHTNIWNIIKNNVSLLSSFCSLCPIDPGALIVYYGVQDTGVNPIFSSFINQDPGLDIIVDYGAQPVDKFFYIAYRNIFATKTDYEDQNFTGNSGYIGGVGDLYEVRSMTYLSNTYTLIITRYATNFNGPEKVVKYHINS